jgi:DNA-directed RNA polymerase subunit RPC12/RpoP
MTTQHTRLPPEGDTRRYVFYEPVRCHCGSTDIVIYRTAIEQHDHDEDTRTRYGQCRECNSRFILLEH